MVYGTIAVVDRAAATAAATIMRRRRRGPSRHAPMTATAISVSVSPVTEKMEATKVLMIDAAFRCGVLISTPISDGAIGAASRRCCNVFGRPGPDPEAPR